MDTSAYIMRFSRPGLSLLEIIVAIAIVAVMVTQAPRLLRFNYTRQEALVADLNALARTAYVHALVGGRVTQLYFDFSASPATVSVRIETDVKEGAQDKAVFVPVASDYGNNSLVWDDRFAVESFIIEGKNEAVGGNLKTVWIYVMPHGLAQQALIGMRDKDMMSSAESSITLQLNPFFVQFMVV